MLMSHNPRSTHSTRQPVGQTLGQRTGIFVSNHAGDCPTDRRMLGRERSPALKELSPAIARKGAVASEGILEDLRVQQRVDAGFSTEQPGFALLLIVGNVS